MPPKEKKNLKLDERNVGIVSDGEKKKEVEIDDNFIFSAKQAFKRVALNHQDLPRIP